MHQTTGVFYAIKENMDVADAGEMRKEYEVLSNLKHENIVTVYAFHFNPEGNIASIYMEYLPMGSLAKTIKVEYDVWKWGLNVFVIRKYARQILSGLSCAHSHGLIHRDIKPANLLITHNGIIKLADFGLCRKLTEDTQRMVGTLQYMSPMIIFKQPPQYNVATDLWGVGCTLIEMLTGKPPYDSERGNMGLLWLLGTKALHPLPITDPKSELAGHPNFVELLKMLLPDYETMETTNFTCEDVLEHDFFTMALDETYQANRDFPTVNTFDSSCSRNLHFITDTHEQLETIGGSASFEYHRADTDTIAETGGNTTDSLNRLNEWKTTIPEDPRQIGNLVQCIGWLIGQATELRTHSFEEYMFRRSLLEATLPFLALLFCPDLEIPCSDSDPYTRLAAELSGDANAFLPDTLRANPRTPGSTTTGNPWIHSPASDVSSRRVDPSHEFGYSPPGAASTTQAAILSHFDLATCACFGADVLEAMEKNYDKVTQCRENVELDRQRRKHHVAGFEHVLGVVESGLHLAVLAGKCAKTTSSLEVTNQIEASILLCLLGSLSKKPLVQSAANTAAVSRVLGGSGGGWYSFVSDDRGHNLFTKACKLLLSAPLGESQFVDATELHKQMAFGYTSALKRHSELEEEESGDAVCSVLYCLLNHGLQLLLSAPNDSTQYDLYKPEQGMGIRSLLFPPGIGKLKSVVAEIAVTLACVNSALHSQIDRELGPKVLPLMAKAEDNPGARLVLDSTTFVIRARALVDWVPRSYSDEKARRLMSLTVARIEANPHEYNAHTGHRSVSAPSRLDNGGNGLFHLDHASHSRVFADDTSLHWETFFRRIAAVQRMSWEKFQPKYEHLFPLVRYVMALEGVEPATEKVDYRKHYQPFSVYFPDPQTMMDELQELNEKAVFQLGIETDGAMKLLDDCDRGAFLIRPAKREPGNLAITARVAYTPNVPNPVPSVKTTHKLIVNNAEAGHLTIQRFHIVRTPKDVGYHAKSLLNMVEWLLVAMPQDIRQGVGTPIPHDKAPLPSYDYD
ncbi:Mitogen-activated protein kinase kinase kinase ANP1 [Diplonema papillatum]|nr:Mitogen-activated protein kinase kinase kinase ANP1 [Diplonema papillatum]